ncbi:MAG: hypothetical protein ACK4N5_11130 [Myxococcales bacterium]
MTHAALLMLLLAAAGPAPEQTPSETWLQYLKVVEAAKQWREVEPWLSPSFREKLAARVAKGSATYDKALALFKSLLPKEPLVLGEERRGLRVRLTVKGRVKNVLADEYRPSTGWVELVPRDDGAWLVAAEDWVEDPREPESPAVSGESGL